MTTNKHTHPATIVTPNPVFGGSLYHSIYDPTPFDFLVADDLPGFIEQLRQFSTTPRPAKEANALICPSLFKSPDNRRRGNIAETSGLWLDNDTGIPAPETFLARFPVRTVVYSSYNATPDRPKYRVYVPLDGLIRDPDYYIFLVKDIIRRFPGFDLSKAYPENLMYLPAANPRTNFGFFHVSPHMNLFPLRSFLPDYLDAKAQQDEQRRLAEEYAKSRPAGSLNPVRKQMRIDKALDCWRQEAPNDTLRHGSFYMLTLRLLGAGCSDEETAAILSQQVHYSHNPKNRSKQIADTIKNARTCWRGIMTVPHITEEE